MLLDSILLVIEIVVGIFHLSMLILLISKKQAIFKGSFYNMFTMILIADFSTFLVTFFIFRIYGGGVFSQEFLHENSYYLASLAYNCNSFFSMMQFVGHFLIALNRFTLLWFPLQLEKVWTRQWYMVILIGVPFLHVCYRLHEPGRFVFVPEYNTVSYGLINPVASNLAFLGAFYAYGLTTFLGAVLNGLSLIKIACLHSHTMSTKFNAREKQLFLVSLLTFGAQLLREFYVIAIPAFTANKEVTAILIACASIVVDIYAWTGCISIMIVSPTTRKAYSNFYLCKKTSTNVQVFTQSQNNSRNQNNTNK